MLRARRSAVVAGLLLHLADQPGAASWRSSSSSSRRRICLAWPALSPDHPLQLAPLLPALGVLEVVQAVLEVPRFLFSPKDALALVLSCLLFGPQALLEAGRLLAAGAPARPPPPRDHPRAPARRRAPRADCRRRAPSPWWHGLARRARPRLPPGLRAAGPRARPMASTTPADTAAATTPPGRSPSNPPPSGARAIALSSSSVRLGAVGLRLLARACASRARAAREGQRYVALLLSDPPVKSLRVSVRSHKSSRLHGNHGTAAGAAARQSG